MKRELRVVKDEQVVGLLDDNASPQLDGVAADVLSALVRQYGAAETARRVMAEGWSNGYLYFAEPTP